MKNRFIAKIFTGQYVGHEALVVHKSAAYLFKTEERLKATMNLVRPNVKYEIIPVPVPDEVDKWLETQQ